LAQPLVRYRVHGRNHFFYRKTDYTAAYLRAIAVNRLFEHLKDKYCYNVAGLAECAHSEFRTIERPTMSQLIQYSGICLRSRMPFDRKVSALLAMVAHFRVARKRREEAKPVAESVPQQERRLAA
jgi:hypothetical protein